MTYDEFTYRCPRFIKELLDSIAGDERFVATIGCGFISALLCAMGFLTGGEYVAITTATVAVYISGKTFEANAKASSEARIAEAAK